MDLELRGKKAIVTGATRGIGRVIAERLASEGVGLAICARKSDEVREAVTALSGHGVEVTGDTVDVRDGPSYTAWLKQSAEALGGLDLFVPNVSAGGGMEGEQNWWNNFEIDVLGTVRGCETVQPWLEQSEAGAIVVIGTTAAVETFMGPMAYNALKGALIVYSKQLSQVLAPKGVRINVVSPGPVYFPGGAWAMIEQHMPELYQSTLAEMPMGRMGTPEEIADAVVFLASPRASLITGVNLVADGGFTKRVQL
jgi:NAD(P)-dependent dehydrogenase (short-subunit alcohol dehydrogenase family)